MYPLSFAMKTLLLAKFSHNLFSQDLNFIYLNINKIWVLIKSHLFDRIKYIQNSINIIVAFLNIVLVQVLQT